MKIYVLSAIEGGYDLFTILNQKIDIQGYIGLSASKNRDEVSGFFHAQNKTDRVPYYEVQTYNLSAPEDQTLLKSLDIDVLIVAGWQRLIPDWLIKHVKVAIGSHGSPLGITKGRGRSPQNWALIMGMNTFEISIFKIDQHIDSGEIIQTTSFSYHPADDIRTSYIKVTYCVAQMIADAIKTGSIFKTLPAQNHEQAEYLPQRTIEDGWIDWNRDCLAIYDFIRAQTKPYPGAFTMLNHKKILVWKAVPFEQEESHFKSYQPGEIIQVFCQQEVLVKCGKGALILTSYEGEISAKNCIFESADFKTQMKHIKERHQQKYPDLTLSDQLI